MKEQLISFETAKLAKEKGFDEKTDNWYRLTMSGLYGRGAKRGGLIPPITQGIAIALAPTQSLLQKWLREKHNFIAWVDCMFFDEFVYIPCYEFKVLDFFDSVELSDEWELIFDVNHDTYEDALEKILFEALKLIK